MTEPLFTAYAGAMRDALTTIAPAISSRRNKGLILSEKVFITGDGGKMLLRADDLDMRITATVVDAMAGVEPGDGLLLDYFSLTKFLAGVARDEIVSIVGCDDPAQHAAAKVTCDDVTITLAGIPIEDFPTRPEKRFLGMPVFFPATGMSIFLKTAAPMMGDDPARYYLNGVFLTPGVTGMVTLVATDGASLVQVQSKMIWPEGMPQAIIPAAAVKAALKAMVLSKTGHNSLNVEPGGKHIEMAGYGWHIETKAVDGTYPQYDRVIPNVQGVQGVTFEAAGMLKILRRAASIHGGKRVPISFDFANEIISYNDSCGGRLYAKWPGESTTYQRRKEVTTRLAAALLTKAILAVAPSKTGNFLMQVIAPNDPVTITSGRGSSAGVLVIVMPMGSK